MSPACSADGADDEDDDEAELQRELAKIRAEREAERKKQAEEEAAAAAAARTAAALSSNPLLASSASPASFTVKRRWDEDVVFRDQTRGEDITVKQQKRFINDSIRSDFHRKFMAKYIK